MKPILIFTVVAGLLANQSVRAQDAATEERLNKLTGHIEMLLAAKAEQDKRIAALASEVETLREQAGKPNADVASSEDVRKLAQLVKEVDQKRIEDNEKIVKQIELIIKAAASGGKSGERSPGKSQSPPSGGKSGAGNAGPTEGYEYEISPGDTLSTIVEAYRAKGVKVSVEDILRANPGLKERSLQIGQKILVPAQ